eukprot:4652647-Pleurochrysis_carterae.AAC.1
MDVRRALAFGRRLGEMGGPIRSRAQRAKVGKRWKRGKERASTCDGYGRGCRFVRRERGRPKSVVCVDARGVRSSIARR